MPSTVISMRESTEGWEFLEKRNMRMSKEKEVRNGEGPQRGLGAPASERQEGMMENWGPKGCGHSSLRVGSHC